MSRKARLHELGDIHHVMNHTIDSLIMFKNDYERECIMDIFSKAFIKYDCHCYGFGFMTNHYHFIVRPGEAGLSKIFQNANSQIAKFINKQRNRRGYVFADRFKSIPTRDIDYLKNLLMYIHSNPLKGGIVENIEALNDYKWTSHTYFMGKSNPYSWLKTDYLKKFFKSNEPDKSTTEAYLEQLYNYRREEFEPWKFDRCEYIKKEQAPVEPEVSCEEAQWLTEIMESYKQKNLLREALKKEPNVLEKLIVSSCRHFKINYEDFRSIQHRRTVKTCKILKLFSYWAIKIAGFSGVTIGKMLNRSNCSVLRLAMLGENIASDVRFPIRV